MHAPYIQTHSYLELQRNNKSYSREKTTNK